MSPQRQRQRRAQRFGEQKHRKKCSLKATTYILVHVHVT